MRIECSHTKLVELKDLRPHPSNRNIHSEKQIQALAKIIARNGQRSPIVVSNLSGFIVKGHGRYQAIKLLGWESCAVDFQNYADEVEELRDRIADNEIARYAEFDQAGFLGDLKALNLELNAIDFEEYGKLEFELPEEKAPFKGEEDDVPPTPENVKTVSGDLYELGPHRLLCGDCTVQDNFQKLMNGQFADLVFTDPPYNVDYVGKTKEALKIQNDKKGDGDFYKFLYDMYLNLYAHMKPGAAFYICHADTEGLNFRKALKDAGLTLKQCLIWVKNSMVMGRQDYHWQHEPILYGWKEGAAHFWYTDRKQTTIWNFDRPSRSEEHPTMKPVNLIKYAITNSSKGKDLVIDPFGGSGSTLIACEATGRIARTMEIDPKYCDVIVDRFVKFSGNKNIRRNGQDFIWE